MKDNMVQEPILKALLDGKQKTQQHLAQQSQDSMQNGVRLLYALLKSLYNNNSTKNNSSNIQNVNFSNKQEKQTAKGFEEYFNENSDFFNDRKNLLDYLKNPNLNLNSEELSKIKNLIETLENEAIKRFCLKNPKYAKILDEENTKILDKLKNIGQTGQDGTNKIQPTFSAEQIEKMSTDEFLENEKDIYAQISNLIKGN